MTQHPPATSTQPAQACHLLADPGERRERAQAKRRHVLRFLRHEGWTTVEVVSALLGIGYSAAHQTLAQMERDGLTTSAALFVPGRQGVVRTVLHGITAQGLAFAYDLDEAQETRTPWEPSKTNPLFVPHQVMAQLARVRAEQAGWCDWLPARTLMRQGLAKIPDGEGTDSDGERVAVEIEREIKTDRRYEAVIGAYIATMNTTGRWSRVDYLCPDEDFAARLARVFGRLQHLRLELPGQPAKVGVPDQAHLDRFRFYSHEAWPSGRFVSARLHRG